MGLPLRDKKQTKMHKLRLYLLSAPVAIVLSVFSCPTCKEPGCPAGGLLYSIPVALSPQRDSFRIGDTMLISMNFPKKMVDERSGIENTFEDFDFAFRLSAQRYDVPYELTTQSLALLPITGECKAETLSSFSLYEVIPHFDGQKYQFEGLIVLKEQGVFALKNVSLYDEGFSGTEFKGTCDGLVVFQCRINSGDPDSNNLDLIKPYLGGNPDNWARDFKKRGGFGFVVR
jgi:hypothetical protein